jgi:hypothetical protein
MVASVTLFITIGAVVLLLPISRRLGSYLEVLAEQRRRQLDEQPVSRDDAARLMGVLETMDQRLAQLEERQAFTDKLLVDRATVGR